MRGSLAKKKLKSVKRNVRTGHPRKLRPKEPPSQRRECRENASPKLTTPNPYYNRVLGDRADILLGISLTYRDRDHRERVPLTGHWPVRPKPQIFALSLNCCGCGLSGDPAGGGDANNTINHTRKSMKGCDRLRLRVGGRGCDGGRMQVRVREDMWQW